MLLRLDSLVKCLLTGSMALRVLLADESSTIKKVIQLALQDFAVEVKSVPIGLDVVPVAKTFKPDLIFVDVLLTKRSGYDVCLELKTDASTAKTPVILMWSGFMDIDEAKASASKADRRLEKPFDAETLRGMVKDLVPKTKSNPVADFLSFPDMPDFDESAPAAQASSNLTSSTNTTPAHSPSAHHFSQPHDDDIILVDDSDDHDLPTRVVPSLPARRPELRETEQFTSVPLSNPKFDANPPEDSWSHQNLGKFKLDLPAEESSSFANKYVIPDNELINTKSDPNFEEINFEMEETPEAPLPTRIGASPIYPAAETAIIKAREIEKELDKTAMRPRVAPPKQSEIDSSLAEKILREEVRSVLENIAWKVLPDVAERIVREEIKKLLQDVEKSI